MVLKKTNILWNSNEISKIFNKNIDKDWTCTGVEIDSRKVKPGNIFLAMPGTEFDGHNFIKDAINMGANSLIIKESLNITKDTFSDDCDIEIDPNLVRGLDYYTGFVFEAVSSSLGAQDAYIGGGRYDELCKQLGGKDLPAIGMAIGIERLAALAKTYRKNKTSLSFIIISSKIEPKAYKIAHKLRSLNNSINIDVQLSEGSLKSKLRRANKDNASYALIIGEDEIKSESIIVKSLLDENSEQLVMDFNDLENFIKKIK